MLESVYYLPPESLSSFLRAGTLFACFTTNSSALKTALGAPEGKGKEKRGSEGHTRVSRTRGGGCEIPFGGARVLRCIEKEVRLDESSTPYIILVFENSVNARSAVCISHGCYEWEPFRKG